MLQKHIYIEIYLARQVEAKHKWVKCISFR
jgi:hypothetical protein